MSAPKACTKCGADVEALEAEERDLCPTCTHGGAGVSFIGPERVELYRLVVLRSAIKLYLRTGMQAGRSWTPQNMRNAAGSALGIEYPRSRRGLERAYADLDAALESLTPTRPTAAEA